MQQVWHRAIAIAVLGISAAALMNPTAGAQAQAAQNDAPWHLDRVDQRDLPLDQKYNYKKNASNVTIYDIGSGIRKTHSQFEGRVSDGYDFVDNDAIAQDCYGGSTSSASLAAGKTYGVAKKAKVVALRVVGCDGTGTEKQMLDAIAWIDKHGKKPAVVHISTSTGGSNEAVQNAIRKSVKAGFTYVVAAGELGKDACDYSPARVAEVITVGGTDKKDKRGVWGDYSSNYGKCVDIWAPGYEVTAAYGEGGDNDIATVFSSYGATALVSGAAALYLSGHPDATNQQVRDALVNNATKNKLGNLGSGSPNRLLYTGFIG